MELYRFSPFQVCWGSTSCLPILCNLSISDYWMKICVTLFSACVHRDDLIFGLYLYLGELYCFSPFQVCRGSTTCLQILCNFSIPDFNLKICVPLFSACVHRNELIFGMKLYLWELYSFSPFQVIKGLFPVCRYFAIFQYLTIKWKWLIMLTCACWALILPMMFQLYQHI